MAAITQFEIHLWAVLLALAIDGAVGGTNRVTRALARVLPHPVVGIGAVIGWLEASLNRDRPGLASRQIAGLAALGVVVGLAGLMGILASFVIELLPLSVWIEGLVVAVFLAGRGLYDHVGAVARGLEARDIGAARAAVGHIVGRDPETLDEAGVARAAIESCAENFSDAVLAPVFWYVLLGLPGLLIYKSVNTADSMIGHKTARYLAFGAASAHLDDALNFIPARLSGGLIALAAWCAGHDGAAAFAAMREDAAKHRSPNAGWPEAAMAGALGLALAGPRIYARTTITDPWMNANARREAGASDIHASLVIYVFAICVAGAGVLILALEPFRF
ncbi:MAG: adenosylcobinamide-phosphate synthase CbiB [Alphaproteobacteria bacterium]